MSDGDIIAAASPSFDAGTIIHFRIHTSILLRSSVLSGQLNTAAVWSDVLRVGDEGSPLAAESYAGVRFVRFKEPAEGLKMLFEIFYKPLQVSFRAERSDPDSQFAKVLKLSTKYKLDDLRLQLVHQLDSEWPKSVKEWDRVDICRDALIQAAGNDRVDEWPPELLPEAATSILLGERFDVPSIVPAAYYDLSRCATTSHWSDQLRYSSYDIKWKGARWEILSAPELLKLHRLRDFLVAYDPGRDLIRSESASCANGGLCHGGFVKDVEKYMDDRDIVRSLRLLHIHLTSWDKESNRARHICHECAQQLWFRRAGADCGRRL